MELGVVDGQIALMIQHVGAFAPHDRAKKAGLQKGDVLIEYDGHKDLLRETDLLVHSINHVEVGRPVQVRIRRGSEEKTLEVATSK